MYAELLTRLCVISSARQVLFLDGRVVKDRDWVLGWYEWWTVLVAIVVDCPGLRLLRVFRLRVLDKVYDLYSRHVAVLPSEASLLAMPPVPGAKYVFDRSIRGRA